MTGSRNSQKCSFLFVFRKKKPQRCTYLKKLLKDVMLYHIKKKGRTSSYKLALEKSNNHLTLKNLPQITLDIFLSHTRKLYYFKI